MELMATQESKPKLLGQSLQWLRESRQETIMETAGAIEVDAKTLRSISPQALLTAVGTFGYAATDMIAIDGTVLPMSIQETFETGIEKTVQWYLDNDWWWRPLRDRYAGQRLGLLKTATA